MSDWLQVINSLAIIGLAVGCVFNSLAIMRLARRMNRTPRRP